jgi:hypothetical protein
MTDLKAISMWQPWASGVALGLKGFETRSWQTSYRGRLVVHAAQRRTELHVLYSIGAMRGAFHAAGMRDLTDFPLGAYVAIVELVAIWPADSSTLAFRLSPLELAFGDFSPGRFAWELKLLEKLDPPIAARGYQGLWDVHALELEPAGRSGPIPDRAGG